LPRYRGCFPIPWAIIDGNPAGVTMHWINEGIDTGDIIEMREIEINGLDTARTVYDKAVALGFDIFKQRFPAVLQGTVGRSSQVEKEAIYHPQGYPNDRWIDWNKTAIEIDRFIRSLTFPPFASARTRYKDAEIEILYPVEVLKHGRNNSKPGEIVSVTDKGIDIATGGGVLRVNHARFKDTVLSAQDLSKKWRVKEKDAFLCA
jgi:methionyl-tRNA formyltransferase